MKKAFIALSIALIALFGVVPAQAQKTTKSFEATCMDMPTFMSEIFIPGQFVPTMEMPSKKDEVGMLESIDVLSSVPNSKAMVVQVTRTGRRLDICILKMFNLVNQ